MTARSLNVRVVNTAAESSAPRRLTVAAAAAGREILTFVSAGRRPVSRCVDRHPVIGVLVYGCSALPSICSRVFGAGRAAVVARQTCAMLSTNAS